MNIFVGVTDRDWFNTLSQEKNIDEVNFWQPSGNSEFKSLVPGEYFLFKLHYPNNFIVGGGIFAHASILPISLAWEAFGIGNGAKTFQEMRMKVDRYRKLASDKYTDYKIGCILLEQPFFLPRDSWIAVPEGWAPNIVQGRKYNPAEEPGLSVWKAVQLALGTKLFIKEAKAKYGEPTEIYPRLGQGSFRILVTDAYERRCAITNERTLPALDAAHIKPFADDGDHQVTNGILLRKDIHALFDKGYITITPSLEIEVSHKIKEEFENGKDYYQHHGQIIHFPQKRMDQPSKEILEWHNNNVYRG
jgi:putative restriction endonuclease